jgi:RNA polymerase sigma-70 factor (ECF subfamily)
MADLMPIADGSTLAPLPRPRDDEARELVARVQAGDRRAQRDFIRQYQRLVAAIVFRMIRDAADREELCQEVFLKIFRHIGQFQGGERIAAWIGRIAGNSCINHLRRRRLPLFDDLAGAGPGLEGVAGSDVDPARAGEMAERDRELHREIDRLPAAYRLILGLFHFSEMSYEEIGRALGMPAGTVKSHLFRARQCLRRRLAPEAMEEA